MRRRGIVPERPPHAVRPAEIVITPQLWNFRTTLEIILDVAQNPNDPELSGLFARFDEVLLQYGCRQDFC